MGETADDRVPDMEELWRQSVRDAPREEAERRPWIEEQVYKEIRRARRGRSHMTAVTLSVLVAKCMGCACSEARAMEESFPLPDVYGTNWARDYANLGFSASEIRAVKRELGGGAWRPRCHYWCGNLIDVIGEGFCVRRTDLSEYFGLTVHESRKVPKWMKQAVLKGFGNKCAACKKRLTPETVTFDHIVPRAGGGTTDVTNLQVLCAPCNAAKADQEGESGEIILTFPLRPAPSDSFEGVIW